MYQPFFAFIGGQECVLRRVKKAMRKWINTRVFVQQIR